LRGAWREECVDPGRHVLAVSDGQFSKSMNCTTICAGGLEKSALRRRRSMPFCTWWNANATGPKWAGAWRMAIVLPSDPGEQNN
jgi:hypothetical protein